jgi:transcriptional regulator with XRE-family HTH domain
MRRPAIGLSQVGHNAGVDRTYVSGVERGVRNPTVTVQAALAQALGVKLWELLKDATL